MTAPLDVSAKDVLPDWIWELRGLATDPVGWLREHVWTIVIEGLITAWSAVLTYVDSVITATFVGPFRAITMAFTGFVFAIAEIVVSVITLMNSTIASSVAGMGLAAPIAAVVAWVIPVVIIGALLQFILGVVSAYIPFDEIPVIGEYLT